MLLIWLIPIVLQVVCVIHLIKTGRSTFWIYIIIFLPMAGVVAYFLIEILPGLLNREKTRELGSTIAETFVPDRKMTELEEQLQLSDTIENRLNLAQEYMRKGMYEKAIHQYSHSLQGFHKSDPMILGQLGKAYVFNKNYEDGVNIFLKLKDLSATSLNHELRLLLAFALEKSGDDKGAEEEYRAIREGSANIEAMYQYAVFLKERGRIAESKVVLEEILLLAKKIPAFTLKENRKWINLAKRDLS